jgi:acyl-CoA synthetase (AMP-forming)/AMP-acid ligase II
LLHTSGTTNRPKLVSITHGAVVANLKGLVKTYALSSKDVALHVLPFFHVAGIVIGLFSTLAAGGCVVIQSAFDPLAFPQLLRKHKVTWFTAVPAMFKAFLEHRGFFKTQNDVTSALRFVRSGAAAMNPKDVQALEALLGVPFVDSYGMTETAGGCVSTLPGIITPLGSAGVSISPGLEIKICDDVGNEVPLGESGEVCLRGPSVTTGYVDNATANEESFFGEKWFRTGDLGYLHSIQSTEAAASETATEKIAHRDSTLWNHASSLSAGPWLILTGRKKEMINRGGEKVSPTEVEDAVLLVEAVAAAVAFPMADATYGEQVAVAAVKKKGIEGTYHKYEN